MLGVTGERASSARTVRTEAVYGAIEARIMNRSLLPGQRINIDALARRAGGQSHPGARGAGPPRGGALPGPPALQGVRGRPTPDATPAGRYDGRAAPARSRSRAPGGSARDRHAPACHPPGTQCDRGGAGRRGRGYAPLASA